MTGAKDYLAYLVKEKFITAQQVQKAEELRPDPNKPTIEKVFEAGFLGEQRLLQALSARYQIRTADLNGFKIKEDLVQKVPLRELQRLLAMPLQLTSQALLVAIADPSRITEVAALKSTYQIHIEPVLVTYTALKDLVRQYEELEVLDTRTSIKLEETRQSTMAMTGTGGPRPISRPNEPIRQDLVSRNVSVIPLVENIFKEAIRRGASDIHIESYNKGIRVRLRVDGALLLLANIPEELREQVLSRIKVIAKLDISERRVPQDGRIKLKFGNLEVDLRVNTVPTIYGESAVARILKQDSIQLDVSKIGMAPDQLEVFRKGIHSPNGLVLVTGPTGSGKTTTLYSALSELNDPTAKIATVEDPVEYNIEGIQQIQVNKETDLTFAAVLRALLRQDPDVILVGEIRDEETAVVGIQAALTGHLVLSSLHTNDAPSAVLRLLNIGAAPFLVAAALNTVVAQRLVRKLCPNCKRPAKPSGPEWADLHLSAEQLKTANCYTSVGCNECNMTGYKGRIAIYEVMPVNEELKEAILKHETLTTIKRIALASGMRPLRVAALDRVLDGSTSLGEALAATMEH